MSPGVQSGGFTYRLRSHGDYLLKTITLEWSCLHRNEQKRIELCLYGWITNVNPISYSCNNRK